MPKSNEVTEEQGKQIKRKKIYDTGQAGDAQTLSSLITALFKKKKKMTLGEGQGNHTKRLTYIPTLVQQVPG